MSDNNTPDCHILVIDTRNYSGNFEREMCAFVTGQVGECGVGQEMADEAREVIKHIEWLDDNIVQVADEGCERPVAIWPTPGRFNDGVGGHYDDTPEARAALKGARANAKYPAYESVAIYLDATPPAEVLAELVQRAKQYCQEHSLDYRGVRLLSPIYASRTVQYVSGHEEQRAD